MPTFETESSPRLAPLRLHERSQVEESKHSITLQNRCGNRMAILVDTNFSELELTYKPNAYRRRDYRARNFSNRDIYTLLFAGCVLPEITADIVKAFHYDPFATVIDIETPFEATNRLTFVNLVDENCFGVAADRPLSMVVKPRGKFVVEEGRLTERFADRGEEIVAFVLFRGFEENRFRIQADGSAVLQLMENDLVWLGGEETSTQVQRMARRLAKWSLNEAMAYNEKLIAPILSKGRVTCRDGEFQKVIDLNKRVVLSGMDAGGACFGALNRIYHLIWNRDGSMATSMFARAGIPDFVKIFAQFILENPAVRQTTEGERAIEYLQILGSRWTKSEDDGIYYVALAAFSTVQALGEWDLLDSPSFTYFYEALDHILETRFDPKLSLFASDTRGESTLRSSHYWGYDSVNGAWDANPDWVREQGKPAWRAYTLYHNVNMFNTLKIALSFFSRRDEARTAKYVQILTMLQTALRTKFVQADGSYFAGYYQFQDGSDHWLTYEENPWEYSWAAVCGPFYPNLTASLHSARRVYERWPKAGRIGYCPWNCLSRFLKIFGMTTDDYHAMLAQEVSEAGQCSDKYPLKYALPEYQGWLDGWRPLPFSAGSFLESISSLLLQSLPCGLAVRASTLLDSIQKFQFRDSYLDVNAEGEGDCVGSWSINGVSPHGTLQIPESLLRSRYNALDIRRSKSIRACRLHGSSASLLRAEYDGDEVRLYFTSPVAPEIVMENFSAACNLLVQSGDGAKIATNPRPLAGTNLTLIEPEVTDDFMLSFRAA